METSTSVARAIARSIFDTKVPGLALAENQRSSGADFIAAGIAGYQIIGRLGKALITKEVARLFRPTGLLGAVGGAAAGACLAAPPEERDGE